METLSRSRRRYRPEEREAILSRFESSGKSLKTFCAAEGVSAATLSLWRRKARESVPGGYACFTLPGAPGVTLRFPCGVELCLPSPDAASLGMLIDHLHRLGGR